MHYHVIVVARLRYKDAEQGTKPDLPVGYTVVVGVNAESFGLAADLAQKAGSCAYSGAARVEVAEIRVEQIEKDAWESDVLKQAGKTIDKPGVYYVSGLVLFDKE